MDHAFILFSRIQFAFTIGFHIMFPAINIGMALFLTVMEAFWLKTKNPAYLHLCKYWTKIFALTFGMGVVGGIVMSYELGTNFGHFTDKIGGVLGSLFAYEVLSAFFLEAGFLGIMLFGWNRVGPKLHFTATLLVMLGTTLSAFWIMAANSWMQTPDGFQFVNGRYEVANWWRVIMNHSTVHRFLHMLFASYGSVCFFIAGISAYYLWKKEHVELAKRSFSFALWAALFVMPIQIFFGDAVGLIDHQYQPLKTAAMEGVWHTQSGAPLLLFAWPDQEKAKNYWEVSVPYGASLLNTHSLHGTLTGLDTVAPDDRPFVPFVFYSFRIMVGLGLIMFLIAIIALYLRIRKKLYDERWFQLLCMITTPIGLAATIFGWVTAECGRQPWIVYNLIRTSDGASTLLLSHVITSLVLLLVVYGFIFSFYLIYLVKFIAAGPGTGIENEHNYLYMSGISQQGEK